MTLKYDVYELCFKTWRCFMREIIWYKSKSVTVCLLLAAYTRLFSFDCIITFETVRELTSSEMWWLSIKLLETTAAFAVGLNSRLTDIHRIRDRRDNHCNTTLHSDSWRNDTIHIRSNTIYVCTFVYKHVIAMYIFVT